MDRYTANCKPTSRNSKNLIHVKGISTLVVIYYANKNEHTHTQQTRTPISLTWHQACKESYYIIGRFISHINQNQDCSHPRKNYNSSLSKLRVYRQKYEKTTYFYNYQHHHIYQLDGSKPILTSQPHTHDIDDMNPS